MQTWAKRGIQTALVTGGLLMLGTGIASADEDVNPDRPASPLDAEPRVNFSFGEDTIDAPVDGVQNTADRVTKGVPLAQRAGEITGNVLVQQFGSEVTMPVDAPAGRSDEPTQDLGTVVRWVSPIRVDGGSIALTEEEAQANGVVGDTQYGVTTDLASLRELSDLDDLPAHLHGAGADLNATGDAMGAELLEATSGLVEASENQTQPGSGVLTGDLSAVPVERSARPASDPTVGTAGRQEPNGTAGASSTTRGGWGSTAGTTQAGATVPVYDVPADILAKALTTTKKPGLSPDDEGSPLHLRTNRAEIAPNELPSLMPLGPSAARSYQPAADPVDDVAGVLSGVINNVRAKLHTQPRSLPTIAAGSQNTPVFGLNAQNLFRPLSGDLFDDVTGNGVGNLPGTNDVANYVDTADSLLHTVQSTGLTNRPTAPGGSRALPQIVPNDLDVTQIVPTIPSTLPSVGDLRAPALRGAPARARSSFTGFPNVDPSTLTDTRAALASLFPNHPIA
jgi:hypothetical protein